MNPRGSAKAANERAAPAEDRAEPDAPEPGAPEAGADAATGTGGQQAPDGAGEAEGPSIEDLVPGLDEMLGESADAARIAELEAENAGLKDRLLRALADLENTRRRAERDRKDAEAYGGTRLARDLLAVHDNLSRALEAADDELRQNHAAFIEGVELTQRELLNAFAKHRIDKVAPEPGEKFDPNLHQAVFEAPIPHLPSGSVADVMQAGFTISGRLLRPAMVGVARGGQAPAATDAAAPADGGDAADAAGAATGEQPEGAEKPEG